MNWSERLRRVERILVWPAWGSLAVAFVLLALNVSYPSEILALIVALLIIAVLGGSTLILVWFYRHWLATWPAVILVWGMVALVNIWPLWDNATSSSGVYAFALVTSNFTLWWTLALMMLRRDAGLALGVATLIAFACSAAVAGAGLGGPANLLLMLIAEGDSGRVWWFNTLITGLMCIAPLAPLTFGGWLMFRVGREFTERGSI